MHHTCVFHNSCRLFLKISRTCRHLHEKFACTACTLMAVITASDSKLHHTSILVQWTRVCLSCIRKRFKRLILTINIYYLIPIANLHGCYHRSNKRIWRQTHVSHIKLLELGTHVIDILLLTKIKRMARRSVVLFINKWDLQITFPAIYKVHSYIRNSLYIHTCTTCRVHSHCELSARNECLYSPRAIDTSSICSAHAST